MDIKLAICDDNEDMIKQLYVQIKESNWNNSNISIDKFTSGKELIKNIRDGIKYDVIFMDIKLEDDYLGTDTGIIVKMANPDTLLVYISSYDSFYQNIALAEPFTFLNKPIDNTKLNTVVKCILERLNYMKRNYFYSFTTKGMLNTVNLNNVIYFESKHRIVIMHEDNGTNISFYKKLDEVEMEIDKIVPYFVRVNKSFLVNLNFIKIVKANCVLLQDGITEINITSKYKKILLDKLTNAGRSIH